MNDDLSRTQGSLLPREYLEQIVAGCPDLLLSLACAPHVCIVTARDPHCPDTQTREFVFTPLDALTIVEIEERIHAHNIAISLTSERA